MDLAVYRDGVELIVAGMAGGVLRSIYFQERWSKYVQNVIVGAIVARYLGQAAPQIFGPFFPAAAAGGDFNELSGFLVGAGGVGIMGWIIDLSQGLRKRSRNDDEGSDQDE